VLIVGTHELQGVTQELAQPFCVLQKSDKDDQQQKNAAAYQITGVVRRKIVFNQYPKTIMR